MMRAGGIGVDFGTATTLVADGSQVLPIGRSTVWMPSLARRAGSALLIGEDADDSGGEQVRSIKRAITQRRATVPAPDGTGEVDADEVIAAILAEVALRAQRSGLDVGSGGHGQVRLGCPAMWDGGQRRRLLDLAVAAGLAGADAVLVDEPVAAAMAWLRHRFLDHGERPTGRLLVVDVGGGTLDVAVLTVAGGPQPEISVLSCLGLAMAGDALDSTIARDFAVEMAANRIDIAMHPQPELAWALLERAARETKVRLSQATEHVVVLPRQLAYPTPMRYRREDLEIAFRSQFDGCENLIFAALRGARLTHQRLPAGQLRALGRDQLAAEVDFVLLAGGMSRVPYVASRLAMAFPAAQIHASAGVVAEAAVVAGLGSADGYERITLHRPGIDVVLEYDRGTHTLYEAFTPLYEPWQIYNGHSELGYERRLPATDLPANGQGCLRLLSPAGRSIPMLIDGQLYASLPVVLGGDEIVFQVTCDGLAVLRDGHGELTALRPQRGWPVTSSSSDEPLALRRV